ncbi:probable glycosyltransferase STELLO1 [Lingula anatina]|uniref:Probable glycosyltransferase STELLO1 n=1 Tax=Lingula anatina TaxID=7574 RepID=A0A1S3HKE2_LINAN|nr:probable glycosyltransferase STELLO1 [Lingula anatina]|eukprot:XP_013386497.1 probable glycosyltransferase STELLO1 [Lingula anatina]
MAFCYRFYMRAIFDKDTVLFYNEENGGCAHMSIELTTEKGSVVFIKIYLDAIKLENYEKNDVSKLYFRSRYAIKAVGLVAFLGLLAYLTIYWKNIVSFTANLQTKTKQSDKDLEWSYRVFMGLPRNLTCERWIVVDAGKHASAQLIEKASDRLHFPWCAIVVSDTLTSSRSLHVILPNKQNSIVYLTGAAEYSSLFKSPLRRKTIGYLFAITSGATMIYEDDGGMGYEWLASSPPLDNKSAEAPLVIPAGTVNIWNPYSYFYSGSDVWPRGFPGGMANRPACNAPPVPYALRNSRVLLVHYLIDGYADVPEKILKSPLKFDKSISGPVEVQEATFVPYSHHSTLHMYDAFWGLLVPTTCEVSISDIIRGYITQRLLWDINGSMLVSPPWTKRANPSRQTLWKSSHTSNKTVIEIVKHLMAWSSKSPSIDTRLKELYLHLFEKGIILKEDLVVLDTWIELLTAVGDDLDSISATGAKCQV